ncbi:hypothetical protein AD936_00680, partial [Gluconobacter japonicus]
RRGRLGPGQTLALDLREGRLYQPDELLEMLASRQDFQSWVKRIRNIEPIVRDVVEPQGMAADVLRRQQMAVSLTHEELETILHPMVETAAEALGSMGDDTPLQVLSKIYRGLSHYFRQGFSQVTNPPIDSLRETRVMSLITRLGNLGNILDERPEQCDLLQLPSPVLTVGEFDELRKVCGENAALI